MLVLTHCVPGLNFRKKKRDARIPERYTLDCNKDLPFLATQRPGFWENTRNKVSKRVKRTARAKIN